MTRPRPAPVSDDVDPLPRLFDMLAVLTHPSRPVDWRVFHERMTMIADVLRGGPVPVKEQDTSLGRMLMQQRRVRVKKDKLRLVKVVTAAKAPRTRGSEDDERARRRMERLGLVEERGSV